MSKERLPSGGEASRRGLIATTGVTAAAVLAGCTQKVISSNVPLTRRTPGAGLDLELLRRLVLVELYAVAAYSAAAPLLSGASARAAKQFLGQELAHVTELEGLIAQAGGKPPKPPASYDLGRPRTERQLLMLLHSAERAQLAAYLAAIPRLMPSRLRSALAAIVANDAQHDAVIRAQLDLSPVPGALVGGQE